MSPRALAGRAWLAGAAVLALGACGDSGGSGAAKTTYASEGERVFAENRCGSCHTFEPAGSESRVGPSLDTSELPAEKAAAIIRRGATGMPAYEDQLSDEEIDALTRYLQSGR